MKFYDRLEELKELASTRAIAYENHSQMRAIMGRRRIGKTTLVRRSCERTTLLYLFDLIGSWWRTTRKSQNNQCEIDIVAIKPGDKEAYVAEVKINPAKFSPATFLPKVEAFKASVLPHAQIITAALSVEDM